MPQTTCAKDRCNRVEGHCFSCLYEYLSQLASTLSIQPRRQKTDAPCRHESGRCVCLALLQVYRR